MLMISSITYCKGLYSSLIDTTKTIELKPKTKKNLIGLEIIGTPLKLSYSRLMYEKNRSSIFFGTALTPLSGFFYFAFEFPSISFFLSHQLKLKQKTSFYYDFGIETIQYYFPTVINNKNKIADIGIICPYLNVGFSLNYKFISYNLLSIKYVRNLLDQPLHGDSEENSFRYLIVPTSAIIIKF